MKLRVLFLFALAACLMPSCDDSGPPIRVILPDGYVGDFFIAKDHEHGTPLTLNDGTYEFVIPDNGRLLVTDLRPFTRFHTFAVQYRSGKVLPVDPALSARVFGGDLTAGTRSGPGASSSSGDFDGSRIHWTVKPKQVP